MDLAGDVSLEAVVGLAVALRDSVLTAGHPVVCHHDPGPNNTAFQHGRPVVFIDFDTAAPGDPLGSMAWTWCVSSSANARPIRAQAAQVRILADAVPHATSAGQIATGGSTGAASSRSPARAATTSGGGRAMGEYVTTGRRPAELVPFRADRFRLLRPHCR